jgi:hypothetical protein
VLLPAFGCSLVALYALLNHFGYDSWLVQGIGFVGGLVALLQLTFSDGGIDT